MNEEIEGASKSGLGIKPLILVAIVIIASVAGILLMNKFMEPDIDPNEISATVVIDYGNGTVEWFNVTTVNNSVPGMLDEAIGQDNYNLIRSEYGVDYIRNINGIFPNNPENLTTLNKSWRYYLEDNIAPGLSDAFENRNNYTLIHEGQTVKLAFEEGNNPSGIFSDTGISVTVKINYGNETVISETIITQNYTALGALEKMVGYENLDITDYDWGVLINGINNVSTGSTVEGIDDTSNYYWFWYVNDDFAYVGASQYVLQDGDVMEWSFEESSW